MTDESKTIKAHSLIMENRSRLSLTGVSDVDSFDETRIVAYTDCGELTIIGTGLHICSLNVEVGELSVEGEIASLTYLDQQPKSSSFFAKLFR